METGQQARIKNIINVLDLRRQDRTLVQITHYGQNKESINQVYVYLNGLSNGVILHLNVCRAIGLFYRPLQVSRSPGLQVSCY